MTQAEVKSLEKCEPTSKCRLPNLLIIGAAKSGTTALWNILGQHPQIFMHPDKQLNFFAAEEENAYAGPPPLDAKKHKTDTSELYVHQFAHAQDKDVIGEASNSYLYNRHAPYRIQKQLRDVRIVAILRHPAERAYSRYLQLVNSGREHCRSFSDALSKEEHRIRNNWWPEFHYAAAGRYYEQLGRYYEVFPKEMIRVYLYDDFKQDPTKIVQDLFWFAGVRQDFKPDMRVRYSASGIPKSKAIHASLSHMRKIRPMAEKTFGEERVKWALRLGSAVHRRNLSRPAMDRRSRDKIIELCYEDTMKLAKCIRRDLSKWVQ